MLHIRKYIIAASLGLTIFTVSSCKKNFGDINTNPSVVITPDVGFLLSYAEDKLVAYQYTEWIWESMEQILRFTQHITTDPYELTSNVNLRYNTFYQDILPNLYEIRRQISLKPDSANYQKAAAVTYIVQVLHGLKVTDMNGSIPYAEAAQGRSGAKFDPVYDKQQDLLNTFLSQLNSSIATLSDASLATQASFGNADLYYKGDWTKWIHLANSLKLRIAARLENQDNAGTMKIFQEVMSDPTGPIVEDADQLSYQSVDYLPFGTGGEITYRSQRFATTSIVDFMKKVNDPRLPVYFEKNGLTGSYKDTLAKYGVSLPSFIDPNDPLIQFQGGPADFTTNPTRASYIKNAFSVGDNASGHAVSGYFLISPVNRLFFSPKYNKPDGGQYKDIMLTATEGCLLIAEFIKKGYAGAVDTKGDVTYWYEKGISSSINNMNQIAQIAVSATAFTGSGDALIASYVADPQIALNGANDLERIYIQEHLNFYRNPNEAFVFARRTGYPKTGSSYYGRETFNELIPRRFWTIDPGETNRANWNAAMADQGFTPNAQDLPSLSSQRIWYDKNAPDFGAGN
jgi:hypothetical protein